MMKPQFRLSKLFAVLITALFSQSIWAISLSTEEFKEYAPEEAYWVVSVDCQDGSEARVIQQKTDTVEWCSKDIGSYCGDSKAAAADQVCSNAFNLQLGNIKQSEAEKIRAEQAELAEERQRQESQERLRQSKEAQRQRQLSIQAELLDIEQQKLSLRRQELELQKRAVEIRDQLKSLE